MDSIRSTGLWVNLGWMLILNLSTKPLWIIVENFVQDQVGFADYGLYAAMFAWGMILAPIMDAGLNQYAVKTFASNPESYKQKAGILLIAKFLLSFAFCLVLVGVALLLSYSKREVLILFACGLIHLLLNLLQYLRSVFQGFQLFRVDSWASVADKALLMLVLVPFLISARLNLDVYLIITIITTTAVILGFSFLQFRLVGKLYFHFRWEELLSTLRASLPFALIIILFTLNEQLNKILVRELAGDVASGLFAAAYRWFAAFSMYLWTILPMFYAKFAYRQDLPHMEQQKLFNIGQIVVALPVACVCIWIFFYGELLFGFLSKSTSEQLIEMTLTVKVLAVALLINAFFNIYSTYLTATGKERFVNRLLIIAIIISNAINYLFIPKYGIIVAALSLALAFVVLSFGYLYYFQAKTILNIPYWLLAKILVITFVLSGIVAFLNYFNVYWLVTVAITGVLMSGTLYWSVKKWVQ